MKERIKIKPLIIGIKTIEETLSDGYYEKLKAYKKAYYQRPEVKAYQKAYYQRKKKLKIVRITDEKN